MEIGKYHKDKDEYQRLIDEMYQKYGKGVHLPAEYANFFDQSLINVLIRLARYKFVAKMLQRKDNVLEIGCGSGVGTILLGQHCKQVVGIDIKDYELEEARGINQRNNVTFEKMDLFHLDEKNKYDVIVCMDVLEHLTQEETIAFIKKVSTLLMPNGFFACGVPSIYSLPYQGALSQASHINCPDRDELEHLLQDKFGRTFSFSMNDEIVHTGFQKMAWYYIILATSPIQC